jgi:hypothetical protein
LGYNVLHQLEKQNHLTQLLFKERETMKTAVSNINVERGGVQAETVFTIKATGKAFDILSSGLYSDKVRAIVRELSCNAHDSHVAAGKGDVPIEVKLPTYLDQSFHVKDFGTGLSHEDVIQIYTTYFESTKTDSDDFIGQLGLGSKSPFSYAATFTVESRHNGVKRVYTCFKNEQGMPAISLMGEEETTEENGVTVALAVKRDDIEKFNDAAKKVYMYFDPIPSILGNKDFAPYRINHTIQGTNWKIREADYYARMSGVYVVQGFVAYPVDTSILSERQLSHAATKLLRTNLDLYVGIGAVEVAASREALSYDIRTIDNLVQILEQVAAEMRTSFQKEFAACTTTYEAAQMYGKFTYGGNHEFRDIFESMHKAKPFLWNGAAIKPDVDLDLTSIVTTTIRRMSLGHGGKVATNGAWTPENTTKKLQYNISNGNLHIVVDKEAKGQHEVVRQYSAGKGGAKVIMIAPTSKKLYNQAEVDLLIVQLGNPPVVYADTLGVVRTKATTYVKRTKEQKMVWQGFADKKDSRGRKVRSDKFSRNCWSTETVVLEDGGFYIDVERFEAVYGANHAPVDELDTMLENAKKLGLIPDDVVLYGVPLRDNKHIADIPEWVNIIDYIREKFTAANVGNRLFNRAIVEVVKNNLSRNVVAHFVSTSKYLALLEDGQFCKLMNKIQVLELNAPKVDADAVRSVARILGIADPTYKDSQAISDEWHNIPNRYGMLKIVNWSALDHSTASYVVNYINSVDTV